MYLLLLRSRCGRGHSCVVAGVLRAELLVPAAARSGVLPLPPSDPSWPQAPESARRRTRKHQARWLRTCQGIWHPKSHSDTRGPSLTTVFTHYRCHSLTLSVSLCFLLYCFNNNNNNNNLRLLELQSNRAIIPYQLTFATQGVKQQPPRRAALCTEGLRVKPVKLLPHTAHSDWINRTSLTSWAFTRWCDRHTSDKVAHYSIYRPRKDERLSWHWVAGYILR